MDELGWIFSPVFTLIGVFLGWFLSKRTQKNMLKVSEIRNELEKAYGPLYSIVSRPEEIVKVDDKETEEKRVVISREEKKELDRILISYPHMFPQEIVVLWRTQIRDLESFRISHEIELASHPTLQVFPNVRTKYIDWFGIPLEFKDKIEKEYERRIEDYYKTTGRWKLLKRLPKWARV